jgi:threonine synthase
MISTPGITTKVYSLCCSKCGREYGINTIQTYATCCHQPLVADYALSPAQGRDIICTDNLTLWRYKALLPVLHKKNIVSLGEGMTPILPLQKISQRHQLPTVLMKDESYNPTGSFKARGISVAVSKAKELGIGRCIIPTAGNAGGAMAAYCAKAGIACTVVMPRKTPAVFKQECELYGATLVLVDGLINDCADKAAALKAVEQYFDVSTMKEPYRLEGKKTMGYEIAEQYNWQLPDVIFYPAGGGTGLIGIWKAFEEMQQLGWIKSPLPRMIAVQAANCNPIKYALKYPLNWKEQYTPKPSLANGLAVPYPFAMDMMLRVLQKSNGTTISISEAEMIASVKEIAAIEGFIISPEGAAAWKAIEKMAALQLLNPSDNILLLNTGTGYKYLENIV